MSRVGVSLIVLALLAVAAILVVLTDALSLGDRAGEALPDGAGAMPCPLELTIGTRQGGNVFDIGEPVDVWWRLEHTGPEGSFPLELDKPPEDPIASGLSLLLDFRASGSDVWAPVVGRRSGENWYDSGFDGSLSCLLPGEQRSFIQSLPFFPAGDLRVQARYRLTGIDVTTPVPVELCSNVLELVIRKNPLELVTTMRGTLATGEKVKLSQILDVRIRNISEFPVVWTLPLEPFRIAVEYEGAVGFQESLGRWGQPAFLAPGAELALLGDYPLRDEMLLVRATDVVTVRVRVFARPHTLDSGRVEIPVTARGR